MTSGPRRIDRVLGRLYGRLGATWLITALGGVICGFAVLAGGVARVWLAGYLQISLLSSDFWWLVATTTVAALISLLVALVLSWREIQRGVAWFAGGLPYHEAEDIWHLGVRLPRALVLRGAVAAHVTVAAALVADLIHLGIGGTDVIWVAASYEAALAATLSFLLFAIHVGISPLIEEIAARLPHGFEPRVSDWPVWLKAIAPLSIITLYTALLVGAFVDEPATGPLRLAVGLGVGVAAVLVAGAMFVMVAQSLLKPIDDLAAATRRVGEGDLETEVPITTADELGQLAASFNRMLADLREREALRAEVRRQADELRASRHRIVTAADAERRRVERDLHDGAQQQLVLLKLKLGLLQRQLGADHATSELARELSEDAARALRELRDLAHGIYPTLLINDGLEPALRELAVRSPIRAAVHCRSCRRHTPELEAAFYFCCSEALQNAAKHAGEGALATVRIDDRDDVLRVEVSDDGPGCDPASIHDSAGIQNMRDRIGAVGGTVEIESAPGAGMRVIASVPVRPRQEDTAAAVAPAGGAG